MKLFLTDRRNTSTHLVKIAMIFLLSLGSLGIVVGSFLLWKASNNTDYTETITNTTRYGEIRQKIWSNKEQIKHFPQEIPEDATNLRLAYFPGFSQGGSYFQLRMKQSPEKIKKVLLKYREIAKHKYKGGNTNDHANLPKGVPTTFFYTSDVQESFPTTYEILVLDAENKGTPGFKWNHGDSYGVAIDSSASEIVYWAEAW
ncbi:hypothetical protein OGM63_14415 [Plectonema radiosum NIES-515]|uniref:Uncharacterized protein n=1 Tax=Plectonema radiosum NIES-515 TaxID=2986073 RepID=A0ABT3AZZ1_9CYAN|nr:hypothetical protein [Plectonema radiosum]MCV3214694.1 hypothetical protein [Plectonema radiosum NIES-515]